MEKLIFPIFGILYMMSIVHCQESEPHWKKKQKSITTLDMAKESLIKANDHLSIITDCDDSRSNISSGCEDAKKTLFYLEVATNLISTVKENFQKKIKSVKMHDRPMDCSQVFENGHRKSGVYNIWLRSHSTLYKRLEVYCDMETDGGGWTVVQRRPSVIRGAARMDFFQDWITYRIGFGNITEDFWFGNDNLNLLSNQAEYKIRFDLEDAEGNKAYALYQTFWIEDEKSMYKLHINNYTGNAGDSMKYHNGMLFSTMDRDNDKDSSDSCANDWRGGWWYDNCSHTRLNGVYNPGKNDCASVYWWHWKKCVGLASTEIKTKSVEN